MIKRESGDFFSSLFKKYQQQKNKLETHERTLQLSLLSAPKYQSKILGYIGSQGENCWCILARKC